MIGKIIGAMVGEKVMSAASRRGGLGAVGGAVAVAAARRGVWPLAMLLAAGYGLKRLRNQRQNPPATA